MRKTVQILLLISACVSASYGQEYKPGKVKLTNGEERSGLVKVATFRSLSKGVTFKISSTTADSVIYATDQLQSYEYDGQRFIPHDFGQPVGSRFLLVLNEGKYSLYQDYSGFYVKTQPEGALLPLVKSDKRLIRGEFVNVDIFKYQLDSLFRTCTNLSGQAMNADYDNQSLSKLITRFNDCMGDKSAISYTNTLPKAIRRFGLRVLGGIGNMNYVTSTAPRDASGNIFGVGVFYSSMGGTVGKGRLGVQVGLDISKIGFGNVVNYNPIYIQFPMVFQYALGPTNGPKPYIFVEGGFQPSIQLNNTVSDIVVDNGSGGFVLSLPIGIGIQGKLTARNNFILSARFYRLTNVASNRISTISITGGITF